MLSASRPAPCAPSISATIADDTSCCRVSTRNAVSGGEAYVGPDRRVAGLAGAGEVLGSGAGGGAVRMTYLAPRQAAASWRRTTFSVVAASAGLLFSTLRVARSSARSVRATRTRTSDG